MDLLQLPENIGLVIRAAYLNAGLNRRQFAKLCGIDYKAVFNWEKGLKKPSRDSLLTVASKLGKSLDELLTMPADGSQSPLAPRMRKARDREADRMWNEFLVTDASLVKLFTPEELDEIRNIRFRAGAPSSPSFYRFIAQAKLEHRAGRDILEALDCEDITPALGADGSPSHSWPGQKKH